jgi:5-methylcytosine-specific restriction endonuclease McrA
MYGPEPRLPNTKRPHIPAALSAQLFARDENTCQYCGAMNVPMNLDHVFAFAQGGDTTLANLVVSCRTCNLLASDRFYVGGFDHKRSWIRRARNILGAHKLALIDAALIAGDIPAARRMAEGEA